MSTRVTQNTRMNAACRELVSEQLNVNLGQALDLSGLRATLDSERLDLSGLQSLVGNAELGGILGQLAPAPFARAQAALAMPASALNLSGLVASAQADLADAVAAAGTVIDGATRDLTVEAFTEAARELGYTYLASRGPAATGIELWRDHELLLLRVHDGGTVESDHMGLTDATCGDRQLELEAAVERRGVTFSGRKQYNHGLPGGGDLIAAAISRGDPSLARATVADAEKRSAPRAGRFAAGEPSHVARDRRRDSAR